MPTAVQKFSFSLLRALAPFIVAAAFASVLLSAGASLAATDGAFGLISQGSTDTSIIRGDTAQASGLDDIILAPWSQGDPSPRGTATACIYTSTGSYQISASSSNGAGTAFQLSSGTSFINYTVSWNDGVSGLQRTFNGTPLTGLVGDSTSANCGGANPATIQVNILRSNMQGAPTGTYSDTLTVMITPQ